ncbi:Maltose transport system permease protein malF [Shigella flexneri]|uniref:Maltose transport system permease protein malF n=1 Tax=Shigella flexneri TaxID=623 RepID=A0A658YYI2_SHIFL|nr:Maltose transport system permease protein malF [Shigella flexneri]
MDGAGPFQNFFKITLPLLIKTADAADDRQLRL